MNTDYESFYKNNVDAIDTKWHQFTEVQFQWIIKNLQSKYKPDATFAVMDLGCGTGRLLLLINQAFPNALLHGIDGTEHMVSKSQSRLPNANIEQHDLNDYKLNNAHDVIISTTVLHHLDNPNAHLNMIASKLNDSGVTYISEFSIDTFPLKMANTWWKATQKSHKQAWSQASFNAMIEQTTLQKNQSDLLSPDWFWRLQIYALSR